MTAKNIYQEVNPNPNFAEIEEQVLNYWKEKDTFKKSIEQFNVTPAKAGVQELNKLDPAPAHGMTTNSPEDDKNKKEFIFYDGPPFANGLPHYGHLLTGFIKDTYARYQTTIGKKVERRFGWDCHGLPAEMGAEKELGISGRIAIMDFGIDKFNDTCRKSVMKYTSEWETYVTRQARWVDFENGYKTMDKNFMESVLWAFKELYKKGYIYESMRVMPYSWACETPLSNFETRLDNAYRERADKAVTVGFKLKEKPKGAPDGFKEYRIMAWTTTPWTLPSNLALAVAKDMKYACVPVGDVCFILADFAIGKYAKELGMSSSDALARSGISEGVRGLTAEIPEAASSSEDDAYITILGSSLLGLSYEPLFDYFANHPNSFRILQGDFVIEGDGTGVVHMAPGFGEDDQIVCDQNDIKLVCPVDNAGKFTSEVPDLQGLQVFDANDPIIIKLKEKGLWIKTEQYLHNYPHCWRTDTPLIYKAVPSWYVEVTKFKDRMVELNQQINWIPEHIKNGMFGKWLENARDWSISRNRFWGTPIPIWRSDDPKYPRIDVYGSIEELEEDFNQKVTDLHRPFIDNLTRPNPDDPTGKSVMRRVEDVFDCWFESGSMPYGQVHYPFENKDWFESHFPADFIVEYSAQTRGWFYTLMVLSTALFDRPPFLNCICHGVILDATGQKLSKRLNNYADPMELFSKYGADALRWTMLSATIVKGQELLIDKDGKMVFETLRLHIKPIWNAYNFYVMYANADGIRGEISHKSDNLLDQYILAKLQIATGTIKTSMDQFDSMSAYQAISTFFEVLNNWYIRRSRARFWESEKTTDKVAAYNTLFTCLEHMCRAISSLLPLISESIYQGLGMEKSVHLSDFPGNRPSSSDLLANSEISGVSSLMSYEIPEFASKSEDDGATDQLVRDMDKILEVCQAGLFIRNNLNIRVRQPLQAITIVMKKHGNMLRFEDLIKDELNIKEVTYSTDLEKYATLKLSINFPVLGKRLPQKMKDMIAASKSGAWNISDGVVMVVGEALLPEEYKLVLDPFTKEGSAALPANDGLVILDTKISDELYMEGLARDVIRLIQQARKDAGLNVSDRINLEYEASGDIEKAIKAYANFISEQTLMSFQNVGDKAFEAEGDVGETKLKIKIELQV
jgi:isoleucyl-tRNA synthetase